MEISAQQYQRLYEILHHYRLEISRLEILQNHGSLVARVDTPGASYVLRICYPMSPLERIQEEIDWLLALKRDTALVVPSPVANEQGAFITSWATSELEPLQHCVLFEWIEGDSVRSSLSQETAASVGTLIARLHRHAQSYAPTRTSAFIGQRYDLDWLIGPASWWSTGRARENLGSDTYTRLQPAIDLAVEAMSRLGELPEHFGIIHADLHFDNILFHHNRCALLDFGDYSLGYYLHDLAITEQAFRNCCADQQISAAFHKGYCQERNLPLSFFHDIDAFMIPTDVIFLKWILNTDNSEARELLLSQVPQKIEHILASAERARKTM
jgi:Ser/Thr protein kinase RdoA (MazF antagonist)